MSVVTCTHPGQGAAFTPALPALLPTLILAHRSSSHDSQVLQVCVGAALWSHLDVPAVDHYGSGVGRVESLHLLQELQHPDGGERHAEVRPAGEVQLGDKPWGFAAIRELLWGMGGGGGDMSEGCCLPPAPDITF